MLLLSVDAFIAESSTLRREGRIAVSPSGGVSGTNRRASLQELQNDQQVSRSLQPGGISQRRVRHRLGAASAGIHQGNQSSVGSGNSFNVQLNGYDESIAVYLQGQGSGLRSR